MTVIDIHTHMLSDAWLQALTGERSDYRVADAPGGAQALYRGDVAFLTLTPAMTDYSMRIADMDAAGVDVAVISLTSPNVYWGRPPTTSCGAWGSPSTPPLPSPA